ncbi:hypothetical protein V5F63_26100, partial [Xanthobacter autotrophicus DSM 597]|uniref:hypothetical protein n=1 Tax=Xanthobacter wiegelii TaxID=3119913 RepID=UPI003729DBE8
SSRPPDGTISLAEAFVHEAVGLTEEDSSSSVRQAFYEGSRATAMLSSGASGASRQHCAPLSLKIFMAESDSDDRKGPWRPLDR